MKLPRSLCRKTESAKLHNGQACARLRRGAIKSWQCSDLGNGGVSCEAVGAVHQSGSAGAGGDGDHGAPLGKASACLVVLCCPLCQSIQPLAPWLIVGVWQRHQTLVHLDSCNPTTPLVHKLCMRNHVNLMPSICCCSQSLSFCWACFIVFRIEKLTSLQGWSLLFAHASNMASGVAVSSKGGQLLVWLDFTSEFQVWSISNLYTFQTPGSWFIWNWTYLAQCFACSASQQMRFHPLHSDKGSPQTE